MSTVKRSLKKEAAAASGARKEESFKKYIYVCECGMHTPF
uniref:Uncharacterized protein n=1 Tax=Rhodnius prolixus TaxID=13249 RepID=A0A905QWK9_RHOPR